jgi:hypothetical protein
LYELESDLVLAEALSSCAGDDLTGARGLIVEIRKMLVSLRNRMSRENG